MDSYGGRDAAISQYYTTYLKNGLVEEEFVIYGCMYIKENEPHLYITGKEKTFFAFQLECEKKGYYCTPGIRRTFWNTVAKGERQNLKRKYQLQVMQELKDLYSERFFAILNELMSIPSKDFAKPLIDSWDKRLDICGDIAQLELFEATVSMLRQMKLLTTDTGMYYLTRIEKLKRQFCEDEGFYDGEKHSYAGFGYIKTDMNAGQIEYLMFDSYYLAWQKQQKLLAENYIVTPIVSKVLYFDAVDFRVVKKYKEIFYQKIQSLLDKNYFELLQEIYRFPHITTEEQYFRLKTQILDCPAENEKEALRLYAAKLRIN